MVGFHFFGPAAEAIWLDVMTASITTNREFPNRCMVSRPFFVRAIWTYSSGILIVAEISLKPRHKNSLDLRRRLPQNRLPMAENAWREVDRTLADAVELPAAARRAYLERAGLAPEVRRRVEQLLDAWEDSGGFLETPVLAVDSLPVPAGMPPGTRLGPWRLVSAIGSGGMGTVYRAERADGQFTQEVAVKVVAAGRVSRALERRFREERQILAGLEHPHVARLIDGGVAPDGSPYLVMEFVAGVPIDVWCRAHDAGARQR